MAGMCGNLGGNAYFGVFRPIRLIWSVQPSTLLAYETVFAKSEAGREDASRSSA